MKILITGATGLVGSEIVRLCREEGIAVNYLSTRKSKITTSGHGRGFYWNPSENRIDLECFKGISAIINLAGANLAKRWTKAYRKKIIQSRLDSLNTLKMGLEKIDRSGITCLVSASAIGVYPDSVSDYYSEEESESSEGFLGDVIRRWEMAADSMQHFGFPIAKIRTGMVLSYRGGALPALVKPVKYYVGAAFGNGEQWQSWIHIRDLSRMYLFAVAQRLRGTYNGVAPNPVTQNKLIRQIAKTLKKPLILPNIPEFMIKMMVGEKAQVILESQRVSSKKIEEAGFDFRFGNICTALQEIYHANNKVKGMDNHYSREFV